MENRHWMPPAGVPLPNGSYQQQPPPPPGVFCPPPTQFQGPCNQAIFPAPHIPGQIPAGVMAGRFRIMQDSIISLATNQVAYAISRPKKSSLSLSGTPAIVISHAQTNTVLATIKTLSVLTGVSANLKINGRKVTIEEDGTIHTYWKFDCPMAPQGRFWWFKKKGEEEIDPEDLATALSDQAELLGLDNGLNALEGGFEAAEPTGSSGMFILKDAKKHGRTVARMANGVVAIEIPSLSQALIDEVIVAAVGMAEIDKQSEEEGQVLKVVLKAVAGAS